VNRQANAPADAGAAHAVRRVRVIDSHTGGEPTRLVIEGGPHLTGPLDQRLVAFRRDHDRFRSAVINEPRGSDVLVGGLLCEPTRADCAAGIIFFNNVGYLGMCGHGTIGLLITLAHLGRVAVGEHRIETPVGNVWARLEDANTVSVGNVASYRLAKDVAVQVDGIGRVVGDIAWGGNWFFLISDHGQRLTLDNVPRLNDYTLRVRAALNAAGITGLDGAEVDHIELFGDSPQPNADSRSFVMCPGGAYDRSPCGTGTSAKLACLQADGKLAEGELWRQESITGSIFEASYTLAKGEVSPLIRGKAWVTADSTLLLDPADPQCWGFSAS